MFNDYYLCCDEAGGKDCGFVVVAGYISTLDHWLAFSAEWNYLLGRFDLPYFHMKEFAHSKGPFASWKGDEPTRARFLSKAVEIIKGHVIRGFASLVEIDIFERVQQRHALAEAVGVPYSLAARTCVSKVHLHFPPKTKIHHIFDQGAAGKGELIRIMERDGYSPPVFRYSRNTRLPDGGAAHGFVPLQAADFAAYEIRKVFKDDPSESWPLQKYRKSLRALATIPSETEDWGRYTEADLVKACTALESSYARNI